MDKEKTQQTNDLEWFVDFVNQDLETISPGDKAKLLIEAEEYLFPWKEMNEFQRGGPLPAQKLGKMAWALESIDTGSKRYWDIISRQQKSIRELFSSYLLPTTHPSPDRPNKDNPRVAGTGLRGKTKFLWSLTKGFKVPYHLLLLPLSGSRYEYVWLKIMSLLEGSPQHAISMCPGCEKYFFNWTRKEKQFCGSKCMWRVLTKRRREIDPEGYREYQRRLMVDIRRENAGMPRKTTKARKGVGKAKENKQRKAGKGGKE